MKNLWILTEERPKKEVLSLIIHYFAQDHKFSVKTEKIKIVPQLDDENHFNFTYQVVGIRCTSVKNIYIKIISGSSSFVDYLLFFQNDEPNNTNIPLYAIEVTKTDDEESRNTGIDQRITKFVFVEHYYPRTKKIMLFHSSISHTIEKRTDTFIFGFRILRTLNVEILQNSATPSNNYGPFLSIDELITQKNSMAVRKQNVSVRIKKTRSKIEISGKLEKKNHLANDPNIGLLTGISCALRKLGWKKDIVITQHGLQQTHVGVKNKFVLIANKYKMFLKGLSVPQAVFPNEYWHYENDGEKLGTIFIHIVVENFTNGYSIFENHAGCEKGYFDAGQKNFLPVKKYTNQKAYKGGDKKKIYFLPDVVFIDKTQREITTVEGKKSFLFQQGIEDLKNYGPFEKEYIIPNYKNFSLKRKVVLFGKLEGDIEEIEIAFCLNQNGQLLLNVDAPSLFTRGINTLLKYWKNNKKGARK